jgi:hypothetical protein
LEALCCSLFRASYVVAYLYISLALYESFKTGLSSPAWDAVGLFSLLVDYCGVQFRYGKFPWLLSNVPIIFFIILLFWY